MPLSISMIVVLKLVSLKKLLISLFSSPFVSLPLFVLPFLPSSPLLPIALIP